MIQPKGDRVLVEPITRGEVTSAGLVRAEDKEAEYDQGTIISVGEGKEVAEFKAGDVLIFQKFGPAKVTIEKKQYIIVHIDEILGKEIK